MKPAPFEYVAPKSLEAALDALHQHGYDAKLLAGGQSLIPVMNFRLAQPAVLIDLNGVPELDVVRRNGNDTLYLGAMVRQRRLERDPLVAEMAPLMHMAIPYIAHPQIRNRGTLGGSLAHADPAGELPAIAVALEARFRLQSAGGERWIDAEEFYTGLFATDLAEDEILVEVALPFTPSGSGCAFTEMARRHGDYALAGVAVIVALDTSGVCTSARIVYLNAGEVPMVARKAAELLVGEKPSETVIEEAATVAAMQEIEPAGDIHATADYKRHLAQILTRRALGHAFARAAKKEG